MLRIKINFVLALLVASSYAEVKQTPKTGVSWDIPAADRADYYPSSHLHWPRYHDPSLLVRTISGAGTRRLSPVKRLAVVPDSETTNKDAKDLTRERRDADLKMEKIAASTSVREARMSSPETWSKQPLSIQFRHRASADPYAPDNYEDSPDTDEAANLPPPIRAHYAPKTDFVTSGRGRALLDTRIPHPEGRESREMPIARSYDEYDVPIFRNVVREHDFDVQIPRNYYYPNRYRTQRDYYYQGSRGSSSSPYPYDRYRDEDEDYEYNRYRPTPKPKRIIYYATLPEIVRKPVDLRDYRRPYDPIVRPEAQIETERNRVTPNSVEPSRRPLRYPYDNYDNYVKRSSYYDRRRPPYVTGEDERRDQERNRASFRDKIRSDDRKLESQIARSGDDRRVPWPVHIDAQVNVKENERIPGRKIFGQIDNYERYEGSRIKKTSENAERKEDTSDESNNSRNNDSSNN